jgi:hypothetical protein
MPSNELRDGHPREERWKNQMVEIRLGTVTRTRRAEDATLGLCLRPGKQACSTMSGSLANLATSFRRASDLDFIRSLFC